MLRASQIMLTLKLDIKISPILYFRNFSVIFPRSQTIWYGGVFDMQYQAFRTHSSSWGFI